MSSRDWADFALSCLRWIAVACALLSPRVATADDDSPATPETAAKFDRIFKDLEQGYASINGTGKASALIFKDGVPTGGSTQYDFEFSRIPRMLRVNRTKSEYLTGEKVVRENLGGIELYNPKGYFIVHKEKKGGSYLLDRVEEASEKNWRKMNLRAEYCFDIPYSALSINLAKYITDPEWKLYGPWDADFQGRKVVRVGLARAGAIPSLEKTKAGINGYYTSILLDPSLGYAVVGYSALAYPSNNSVRRYYSGNVEYERNPSGPPIPKSYVFDDYGWNGKDLIGKKARLGGGEEVTAVWISHVSTTFDTFEFTAKPESDFQITAFGLPDITLPPAESVPAEPAPAKVAAAAAPTPKPEFPPLVNRAAVPAASRTRFDARWLFALAAACFIAAVGFKVLVSRRASSAKTPLSHP